MAKEKSIYWNNCLKAIRQTVYGRDNRKAIADAIDIIHDYADSSVYDEALELYEKENERVISITPTVRSDIIDWVERVATTVSGITMEDLNNDSRRLGRSTSSVNLISGDDYLLNETMNVVSIGNDDYQMTIGDSTWEIEPDGSVSSCQYIPRHETYTLVVTRANGR